jgi:O-antigen/teichoic acid export membrane protein
MLKQFVKNTSIYTISNVITRGISIILVPFYTRVFTPADYGIIDLLSITTTILTNIFTLEITQAVARFYPDTDDIKEARKYASTGLLYTIFALSIMALLIIIFSDILNRFAFSNEVPLNIIRINGICVLSTGLFYFVQNQLKWRLEPFKQAVCSIFYSVVAISLTVIFVLVFHYGIAGVFIAQLIGGGLAFLLGFYFSRSSYEFRFYLDKFKEMAKFSIPLVPTLLATYVLGYADRLMINAYMTLNDLGLFGVGYRFTSVVNMLMLAIQGSITPIIFANYKKENTPVELSRIFNYFVFLSLLGISFMSLFSLEAIKILTTPEYYYSANIIPLLVLATFFNGIYVFTPGLSIEKKTKLISAITVSGAIINVSLNFVMIPAFGIIGASTVTLVSSIFMFFAYFYFSQKYYYIPFPKKILLISFSGSVAITSVGLFVQIQNPYMQILFKVLAFFILFLFLVNIKLVNYKEGIILLKNKFIKNK